jgi:hypothetical protein
MSVNLYFLNLFSTKQDDQLNLPLQQDAQSN